MSADSHPPIKRKDLPQYKTPLAFAEWRVNEFKKPVEGGIINETIDATIELVNGILGQYISIESKKLPAGEGNERQQGQRPWWAKQGKWGEDVQQFEEGRGIFALVVLKFVRVIFFLLGLFFRGGLLKRIIGVLLSIISFFWGYLPDDWRRVAMPIFIYICLFGGTLGAEYNYNIYRLLALLLLYIISYTELTYGKFCILFLLGIALEISVIAFQSIDEES
jgi:hypothetical protein